MTKVYPLKFDFEFLDAYVAEAEVESKAVDEDFFLNKLRQDQSRINEVINKSRSLRIKALYDNLFTDQNLALHEGYSKNCGLKGSKLSGGQKQRIAIARALIKDPKILILDEATSALDENSQEIVQQALDRAMEGRTSIVIAHRLSTIRNCNILFVIDKGRIVECGSYDELTAQADSHFNQLKAGMEM